MPEGKQKANYKLSSFNRLLNKGFLFAFLIIGAVALGLCYSIYQDERTQAIFNYQKHTQLVSYSLTSLVKDFFIKLENTQQHWISDHEFTNLSELEQEEIGHIYALLKNDHITAVSIISPDMKLVYSYPQTGSIGADLSSQKHNQRMVYEQIPIISSPFKAVQGYNTISIATPIKHNGKYIGAVSYLVDFDALIKSYLALVGTNEYENVCIFDNNRSIIYDTKPYAEDNENNTSTFKLMNIVEKKVFGSEVINVTTKDGTSEKRLISFSTTNINERDKWYICMEAPLKKALKRNNSGFTSAYIFPLVLFLLLFVLLNIFRWFFADRYAGMLEKNLALDNISLKEAEFRLSTILNSLPYIIFEADKDKKFTFLRAALNRIQGISLNELYGERITDFITEESKDVFEKAFKYLMDSGKQLNSLRINMLINPTEPVKTFSISAFPKNDQDGNIIGISGILHDISERVELEGNLIQSQKMEVIGSVTSSVAHDFNNYLATMLGYVGLMKMKGSEDEDLNLLESAIEKASDLTEELLTFSRKSKVLSGSSDLNKSIDENIAMLKNTLPSSIKIKTNLDEKIPQVQIDKSKLDQILLNMLVNAKEAMPDGGVISLESWSTELNVVYAPMMNLLPGKYIVLKIADTGIGLDAEAQKHIFEPYYTTKKEGTGLGMATVYAILNNARGTIIVRSNPGKGTEFVLYIPAALSQAVNKDEEKDEELHCLNLKNKTVLLVEDEKFLADVIEKSLNNFTKNIISRRDGIEGLSSFRSMGKDIGLVISDIAMDGMDGLAMVSEIRKLKHGRTVPIMFITGNALDENLLDRITKLQASLLKKPFTITKLINELNICE